MMPFSNYIKSITLGINIATTQIEELKIDKEQPSYNKKAIKRSADRFSFRIFKKEILSFIRDLNIK